MNIIFDVHIANPDLPKTATLEQNILLNEIYLLVEERIKVLKDEIDAEEKIIPKKATVIYLKEKKLQPRGYSDSLCDKILSCFSENDWKILGLRLDEAFSFIN